MMPGIDLEDLVRLRAYAIWVEEGQPEGREREHWMRARREMQQKSAARDVELDEHPRPQDEESGGKDR